MADNKYDTASVDFNLPYADVDDLKSNQSVRATFRLSEKTISAMSIVSNQLGVKQKSLFDHLIADTDALKIIARELDKTSKRDESGIQKTFVISRKTLAILQKMAKDHKASRDALVEFSIRRLKPIIEQERAKQASREGIASKIRENLEAQKKLLAEAYRQLGVKDPVCEQLSLAVDRLESASEFVDSLVKKGERIAAFNM